MILCRLFLHLAPEFRLVSIRDLRAQSQRLYLSIETSLHRRTDLNQR